MFRPFPTTTTATTATPTPGAVAKALTMGALNRISRQRTPPVPQPQTPAFVPSSPWAP